MNGEDSLKCGRCGTALVHGANYCHICGVSVEAAVTGEYELYDLDRFFHYALDMLCIAGVDGYLKRVNPAFERVLGYSMEELLARPFVDLIHPDDQIETVGEVGKLASGRPTLSFVNRYLCKDGTYKRLHWTAYPEPQTGLLYAVARDLSEFDS
jgi:PAS domain S-box-containing protein